MGLQGFDPVIFSILREELSLFVICSILFSSSICYMFYIIYTIVVFYIIVAFVIFSPPNMFHVTISLLSGWHVWLLRGMRRHVKREVREYLSTGQRLRFSTEIYESKREKTVFHQNDGKHVLFLQESSKTSGNFRELTGAFNVGILHSSSLF